jgi:hypothetical protein
LSDLFEEVEEQLRSERYQTLVRKAFPWVLGIAAAALIVALGYWGWDSWRTQTMNKASETYQAGLDAYGQGKKDEAVKDWTDVSQSGAAAYKALALMQLGGLKVQDGKLAEAVPLFDQAASAAPDDVIGDAARLKSAFAVLDTAPYPQVEARLTPLMKEGRPYRVQAREALAFAKLQKGDMAGARADFALITTSLDAPEGARERAKAATDMIDSGSAKSVPAVAKAAAALPPPMMIAPGQAAPAADQTQQAPGPQ